MQKRLLSLLIVFIILSMLIAVQTIIYQINPDRCWNCGRCTWHCPTSAIQFSFDTGHFFIAPDLCNGCGACVQYCPYGAIYSVTSNADENNPKPELKLKCSPNPAFNYIDFSITTPSKSDQATLTIFNPKGQKIYQRKLCFTDTNFRWCSLDDSGKQLASGIYLAHLACGKQQVVNKITVVKK